MKEQSLRDIELNLLPPKAYSVAFTCKKPVIGFAFDSQQGLHAFCSDKRHHFLRSPNSFAYTPPGCDVYSESESGGEYLTIHLSKDNKELGDQQFNDKHKLETLQAAKLIRKYLLGCQSIDKLDLEAAVNNLIENVRKTSAVSLNPSQPIQSAGWLTKNRFKKIEEFIEAHLADEIMVSDIAKLLGLSSGFLNRAMKAAIGVTPHSFIIDRRIALARRLIAADKLSLKEIAQSSGFSSQSHMTSKFKQHLGVTPANMKHLNA